MYIGKKLSNIFFLFNCVKYEFCMGRTKQNSFICLVLSPKWTFVYAHYFFLFINPSIFNSTIKF